MFVMMGVSIMVGTGIKRMSKRINKMNKKKINRSTKTNPKTPNPSTSSSNKTTTNSKTL